MPTVNDAINHTISIVRGHTGMDFSDRYTDSCGEANGNYRPVVWLSTPVSVKRSDQMFLVATQMQLQITIAQTAGGPLAQNVIVDPETFFVNATLLVHRHEGPVFPINRTLQFNRNYFCKFV